MSYHGTTNDGTLLRAPQPRSLKRSREGENFDSLIQKIQDCYGIQLATEAQQMAWSPSKRANDLGKCLAKMRQLYWRSPELLAQRLELFDNLDTSQHNLQALLSVVDENTKSGGPSPTKMFMEYRSSSGEDTEATSYTVSPSEGSNLTAPTERSPPSPILLISNTSNSPSKRDKSVADQMPQSFSSDYDNDYDLSQLMAETTQTENEDVWLRRRSSAAIEAELDYAMDMQAEMTEAPGLPDVKHTNNNVDPAWISACPLMSQSDVGKGQLVNNVVIPGVAEPLQGPSIEGTGKEHYHLRELTNQGLFANNLQYIHDLVSRSNASSRIVYELSRIALANPSNPEAMMSTILPILENEGNFWLYVDDLPGKGVRLPDLPSKEAWDAAKDGSPFVIRCGRVSFRSMKADTLFRLTLEPLQLQSTSSRFFRQFGSSRFLRLLFPALDRPPQYLNATRADLLDRVQEWLRTPNKEFMGCKWSVFHTRRRKARKSKLKPSEDEEVGYEVMLFATEGPNLKPISLNELLNWFLPVKLNQGLSSCKAFARLELGLSKTYATLVFKPSQVRWCDDILANGEQEDRRYRDPAVTELSASDVHDRAQPRVMNDGCARLSCEAARQIWLMLNEQGPVPSAFQGRIGPWKGMWMLDDPHKGDQGIWIEVNHSQRKFEVHPEDLNDEKYDHNRLTFEVVAWSRKPATSTLYPDFLPIMEHRGVSRTTFKDFVNKSMDDSRQDIQKAVASREQLYKWLQDTFAVDTAPIKAGSYDLLPSEKALKMLAAGFKPASEFVKPVMRFLTGQYYTRLSSQLNNPVPQSTSAYGVADLLGCLKPDEIHLSFSSHFGGESRPFLHGVEVIVARHPALRPSDLQKVKAVFKLELSHLVDVIVFPTRGTYPLAGKLQGGDYDGDKFWVCWSDEIVKPFLNAPIPLDIDIKPETLGIQVDRTKLGDLFKPTHKHGMSQFLKKSFDFAWQCSCLGISTNYFGEMCYSMNLIDSKIHRRFASLHDYLVDTVKNGYTFSAENWKDFKTKNADPRTKVVAPAWRTACDVAILDPNTQKPTIAKYKRENISDFLVFEVARPKALSFILESAAAAATNSQSDESLTHFFLEAFADRDPIVREMAKKLRVHRDEIMSRYTNSNTFARKGNHDRATEIKEDARQKAAKEYRTLRPSQPDHPNLQAWLRRATPSTPSLWDLLKASAAAAMGPSDAWLLAGNHILFLKAHMRDEHSDNATPTLILPELYSTLRVKKRRLKTSKLDEADNGASGSFATGSFADTSFGRVEELGAKDDDVQMRVKRADNEEFGGGDGGRDSDEEFYDATGSQMKISK